MSATDTKEQGSWSGSGRIAMCGTCGREHPTGKRHCAACGRASAFISEATEGLVPGVQGGEETSRAYIGIDPSLTGTAVAIIWGNGTSFTQRLATEGHEGDTAEQYMWRMDRIEAWVRDRIEGVDADTIMIGIEGPSLGPRRMGLDHERAGLWHRLYKRARLYIDTTVVVVSPKQRAKYATGNGNAGKAEVLSAVCARHPREGIRTHDEADAFTIAAMLARLDGHPIDDPLPKTHTAALDKLIKEDRS